MKRIAVSFSLIISIFFSCSPGKKERNEHEENSIEKNEPGASATGITDNDSSENIFRRYDKVKTLLEKWNSAIDNNEPGKLNDIYGDEVFYYVKLLDKAGCISAKTKWLNEHPGYRQKTENVQVYYYDQDTALSLFAAEFDKICFDKNKETRVASVLHFANEKGEWKIVKETDLTSIISIANKSPGSKLGNGEYVFSCSYWADTRDIKNFAHESVPYHFTISLDIGDTITGDCNLYSGTMRQNTNYLFPSGKIENGILELLAVYNGNGELSLEEYLAGGYENKETERWHFKIINGNELVGLDPSVGYLYGKSLLLEK